MTKYKLHVYGWEIEALGHSITNDQVQRIKALMEENGYDRVWECLDDLEEKGILDDIYGADLFHISRALDNGTLRLQVWDENEQNIILEFEQKDLGDFNELIGDDDFIQEKFPFEGYMTYPEDMEGVENILFIAHENKGGVAELRFESDEIPTAKDFCFLTGSVGTPESDWDFISKFFFKGQPLEFYDNLDNTGKATTVEIYTKDGDVLS